MSATAYFAGSVRRVQVTAVGWHAIPMLAQTVSPVSGRRQVRQPSFHSRQVLSLTP
jgi:hypothetical protein